MSFFDLVSLLACFDCCVCSVSVQIMEMATKLLALGLALTLNYSILDQSMSQIKSLEFKNKNFFKA